MRVSTSLMECLLQMSTCACEMSTDRAIAHTQSFGDPGWIEVFPIGEVHDGALSRAQLEYRREDFRSGCSYGLRPTGGRSADLQRATTLFAASCHSALVEHGAA